MRKFLVGIAIFCIAFGFSRAQNTAVPNPKLQEIMAILPVPENPDRVTEADWNEFEAQENIQFPQDFKDFINVYGCGTINKTLQIMAPMCLAHKGKTRAPQDLMLEFCSLVFMPPTTINFNFSNESSSTQTNSSDEVDGSNLSAETAGIAFDDFLNRSDELFQECENLAAQFYTAQNYVPETSGRVVLEELQDFLVAHYQDTEPFVAAQLRDADLSQIKLESQDETQFEFSISLIENFEDQLRDLLSSSQENQQLNANQFYLWGDLRGSEYNLGWLTHKDETGIQVISEKTFLLSHDKLDLLDTDFLDVVLRLLKHDQTLFAGTEVFFQPDDIAFSNQQYEFVPNPNRRTP